MSRFEDVRRALSPSDQTEPPPEGTTPELVEPTKPSDSGGDATDSTAGGTGDAGVEPGHGDNSINISDGLGDPQNTMSLDAPSGSWEWASDAREWLSNLEVNPMQWMRSKFEEWMASTGDWLLSNKLEILAIILSTRNIAKSHKHLAKLINPSRMSNDNYFGGALKSGANLVGAASMSAVLGGVTFWPTAAALYYRSMDKRMRAIENSGLTDDELHSLFRDASNPDQADNQAKLDHLWELVHKIKNPRIDQAEREAAVLELFTIPGFGDQDVKRDTRRRPIDIQRRSRFDISRILEVTIGKLPKIPEPLAAGTANLQEQKEALFNDFILKITGSNPLIQNRGAIPFWRKSRAQGYYTAHDAKDVILDNISPPPTAASTIANSLNSTQPDYWVNNDRVVSKVCDSEDARSYIIDKLNVELPVTDQANIEMRADLIGRTSKEPKVKLRQFWKGKQPTPFTADDVKDADMQYYFSDKGRIIGMLNTLKRTHPNLRNRVLEEVQNRDSKIIEDIIVANFNQNRSDTEINPSMANLEAAAINKRISKYFGNRKLIPPEWASIADAGTAFLPFVTGINQDILNAILETIQFGSISGMRKEIQDIKAARIIP